MKKILILLIASALISCTKEASKPNFKRISGFEELKRMFPSPPVEYQAAPLWAWNGKITKSEIDRTLADYKNAGIGGAFIHPRYGMITEYLSDEWWELVEYSLRKAEELDMNLWIYDENSYPSGYAGGHVPAQMPEAGKGVALIPRFTNKPYVPPDISLVKHIFKNTEEGWVEIPGVEGQPAEGEYCFIELKDYPTTSWFAGHSYVDLLLPGITEKFLEVTMSGYEKALGREFGRHVPGVFTDEPNLDTYIAGAVRYTADLYEQFERIYGYRLEPHLMSLWLETGDWKKVRHDHYSLLLQLFIDRWSKPWYKYTEEKNLLWTGHYWEHTWPDAKHGPDHMAMYAWHQLPGIDLVFNSEESRPEQVGNIRNVKELSSVVNQMGRYRALSETYGGSGWELTFQDMKRMGDWLYVLGVNFMNLNSSFISIAGERKADWPVSFAAHAPYWDLYKYHADYFARLSLALSSGLQKNELLILEPTTTTWSYYSPIKSNPKLDSIALSFNQLLAELEFNQIEYDLGSERIIKDHGKIVNGKFVINHCAYSTIILPKGNENLQSHTFMLIKKFLEIGGKVYSIAIRPDMIDGRLSKELKNLSTHKNWIHLDELSQEYLVKNFSRNNLNFTDLPLINLFHQTRQLSDGRLMFFFNFDKKEFRSTTISVNGASLWELNLMTGEVTPSYFRKKEDKVEFDIDLPPAGSRLVFISDNSTASTPPSVTYLKTMIESAPAEVKRIRPNVLTMDYVELTLGNLKSKPMYYLNAAREIWNAHGFRDNPWWQSIQFKTEIADRDTFSKGTGFKAEYPFFSEKLTSSGELWLVVERPHLYSVSINDELISPMGSEKYWLDPDFRMFDVSGKVKPGKNKITLKADPFSIYAELQPIYLLGDFNVEPAANGWKLTSQKPLLPGSWKQQGLPFYGQSIAYSKKVSVETSGKFRIELPEWEGTVAELRINGKHKGIIQSQPWIIDFELPVGENMLEILVYGSLKNVFGPHHNVSIRGLVHPWSFKDAPDMQPSGVDYDLLDYGLMQDFIIYVLKEDHIGSR